jgi:FixJ family two-component response regulator
MNDLPTVFLVDDDVSVLRSVERLLRSGGYNVSAYRSARAFLAEFQRPEQPCCLVLDIAMPKLGGIELQDRLVEKKLDLPIVFITGHGDVPTTVRAMKGGAVDFLTKPFEERELLQAVRQALYKDRMKSRERAERSQIMAQVDSLTSRENQVLRLVVTGMLNKQIAATLGTCEKTIKVHRGRVMRKMNVQSVAELVRKAEKAGLFASPPPAELHAGARSTPGAGAYTPTQQGRP